MVGMTSPEEEREHAAAKEAVLKLMGDKTDKENEIKTLFAILQQNGVGMEEPLVDSQGFPRNDIDTYQVRLARHRIICLRNDLKGIMKSIEEGLHRVHASASARNLTETVANGKCEEDKPTIYPIARINVVTLDSPASLSGLQTGDLILEFGSVNGSNFTSLEDISRVVQHSNGARVDLLVNRAGRTLPLQLYPRPWSGRGLLGCSILPLDAPDTSNRVDR